jgi:hypothetical protein
MSSLNPIREKPGFSKADLLGVFVIGFCLGILLKDEISPFFTSISLQVRDKAVPVSCNQTMINEELDFLSSKNACFAGVRDSIRFNCLSNGKVGGYARGQEVYLILQDRNTVAHELFHVFQYFCLSVNESDVFVVEGTASLYAESREHWFLPIGHSYPLGSDWLMVGLSQAEKDYALSLMLSGDRDTVINRVKDGDSEVLVIEYKSKQVFGDYEN